MSWPPFAAVPLNATSTVNALVREFLAPSLRTRIGHSAPGRAVRQLKAGSQGRLGKKSRTHADLHEC
jgi:hypothetical protein